MVYGLTSGTTGEPKAIVVTHEQMHARVLALHAERIVLEEDRLLSPLPLAFGFGRGIALTVLCLGATLVLFPSLYEPEELVAAVNRLDIGVLAVAPNTSRVLLRLWDGRGLLMPKLRLYATGSAKQQPEERAAIRARICPHVVDYYASIGTGPISLIATEEHERAPTSVGRLVVGSTVEIVDASHRRLPPGEIGWIRASGPGVCQAFAGEAPAADERLHDGWYYPGDLGSFDKGGLLHLHGRTADLIKRGGFTVHAQEVEQVLRLHASVADAAVIGLPSEQFGEEVTAFVVLREPVAAQALVTHCRKHLAPHKVPTRIEFVQTLPRNSGGKVVKAALRRQGKAENPPVEAR
jgi:acyl-coenzyme A synthetase/AMP-(fatty) acid ligase